MLPPNPMPLPPTAMYIGMFLWGMLVWEMGTGPTFPSKLHSQGWPIHEVVASGIILVRGVTSDFPLACHSLECKRKRGEKNYGGEWWDSLPPSSFCNSGVEVAETGTSWEGAFGMASQIPQCLGSVCFIVEHRSKYRFLHSKLDYLVHRDRLAPHFKPSQVEP